MRIAAIDQGTTSTRVVLCSDRAPPRLALAERHAQHYPQAGWVEHDPEELLANIRRCLAAAGPVDAIALTNQGESCLAWDGETGEALSPVIVWQDARTLAAVEALRAAGHEPEARARSGLGLDPYFSASKLAWLLQSSQELRRRREQGRLRLGTTDAWFLQRLTGRAATDVTTAARTGLMHLGSGQWDPWLCDLYGLPIESLPPIVPPLADYGAVDGVPLRSALVDQVAALYGHGCRKAGDLKITFGTGAFALALLDRPTPGGGDGSLLEVAAWPIDGRPAFALDGGVYNAGSAIEWLDRIGMLRGLDELASFERAPAIERGLAFVPALSGLACPHFDRRAAGLWIGMGLETERGDLLQAALEGIALRSAEVVAAIESRQPGNGPISIDGGLTGSAYFCSFLATAVGRPVLVQGFAEMTAFGAAALLADAEGVTLDLGPERARRVEPGPNGWAWRQRFAAARERAQGWRQD